MKSKIDEQGFSRPRAVGGHSFEYDGWVGHEKVWNRMSVEDRHNLLIKAGYSSTTLPFTGYPLSNLPYRLWESLSKTARVKIGRAMRKGD